MKFEWEQVSDNDYKTFRAKVIGGWLVRYVGLDGHSTMCFIEDRHYTWVID